MEKTIESNNKEVTGVPTSLLYVLVEEALWAHRELQYSNMFDCVVVLLNLTNSMNSRIGKRITNVLYKVCVKITDDKEINIPAYDVMRIAYNYFDERPSNLIEVCDCNGNKVSLSMNYIMMANDYIGRVLMITLFDILNENKIDLPEEIYATRH